MKDYLTLKEVARLKGVTPVQVLREIKRHKYPTAQKRGGVWFIHESDLK